MRVVQVLALGALLSPLALEAARAGALPPPPYAAQAPYGADAAPSDSGALDRYGGGLPHPTPHAPANRYAFPVAETQGAAASPAPRLSWAGKTPAAGRPGAQASDAAGQGSMSGRWGPPAPAEPPVRTSDASAEWRRQSSPAPRSIYDAPEPAPAPLKPQAQVQARPGGPRFYSLHRDYGIEPDAIPIPPQFFGPTADLSAPPGDPAVKRVAAASGQTRTVAVTDDTAQ